MNVLDFLEVLYPKPHFEMSKMCIIKKPYLKIKSNLIYVVNTASDVNVSYGNYYKYTHTTIYRQVYWNNVSSDFVTGFLNIVSLIKAFKMCVCTIISMLQIKQNILTYYKIGLC